MQKNKTNLTLVLRSSNAWRIPGTGEPGDRTQSDTTEATKQQQQQWELYFIFSETLIT